MKILEVQGLRGIATLSVLVFHLFSRWGPQTSNGLNLYPFEPIQGWLGNVSSILWIGVQLFFMISGFVIALSLNRADTFFEFWRLRFSRLWPPLVVALPLIWLVLRFSPTLPGASRDLLDLAGSFSLVKPALLTWLMPGDHHFDYTTGVLWTLWIELLFYFLASLIHFARLSLLNSLVGIATVISATDLLSRTRFWLYVPEEFKLVTTLLTGDLGHYIWWFVAGVAMYTIRFQFDRRRGWVAFSMSFAATTALGLLNSPTNFGLFLVANIIIFALFASISNPRIAIGLSARPLVFVGTISYELYLIHEALGVSFLQLVRIETSIRSPIASVLIGGICILIAHVIYRWWSLKACSWTKTQLSRVKKVL